MPHVIVKLWPGKTEDQKQRLAAAITQSVTSILGSGEASVSVAMEEVPAGEWTDRVYRPDIDAHPDRLYKKPGYGPMP